VKNLAKIIDRWPREPVYAEPLDAAPRKLRSGCPY
jgi:hypothetical protein